MQDEVVRVQAQFALLEIAGQAAAGILHGGRPTIGIEAHAGQVAAELQALGAFLLRPVIQAQVAQGATGRQPDDQVCGLLGQGHQGIHQRQQRRHVQAVRVQAPLLLFASLVVEADMGLAPALLADVRRQGVQQDLETFFGAGEVGVHAEVAQDYRLALGIGATGRRHMQPGHGPLQAALGPFQPDLAPGLKLLDAPFAGQAGGQPARPVALRQAEVEFGVALQPGVGVHPGTQAHGHWLAIGQAEAAIEALATGAGPQAEADLGDADRRLPMGHEGELAVEDRNLADPPQLVAKLSGAGQRFVRPRSKALQMPFASLVLAQTELDVVQLQAVDARLARHQAAKHVGYHPDLPQAQGALPVPQHHVMGDQQRPQAMPATFQAADLQGLAEGSGGPGLGLDAILGHQRHQLAAQADVERRQHQAQGAERQQPAQGAHQPAGKGFHSAQRLRAGPHRTVPGSTWFPPGT
ncbi:hypothetical protein D9M68_563540 [compost metagenome]